MIRELELRGVSAKAQVAFPVCYKDQYVREYVADLVVEEERFVELKCVDRFSNEHPVFAWLCSSISKDPGWNGSVSFEFRLHQPSWAGVLSTAGGLVFGGSDEGNFFALDASTGKPLWDFQTGGAIAANPISFALDGKQHIAIAADRALFVFER